MPKQAGFTLIELLIVIALLGALAIGLLATIDPFEQLKKGRDTATRNTVTEFYNSALRYYGTKGDFPWSSEETSTFEAIPMEDPIFIDPNTGYIAQLISFGELKNNFISAAGMARLRRLYVTSTAPDELSVCFIPESKNFQMDPNTVFDESGNGDLAPEGHCIATNPDADSNTCQWCIH
jgi:prepilin-type N-terminal cleavage/methylation domain-containing protein